MGKLDRKHCGIEFTDINPDFYSLIPDEHQDNMTDLNYKVRVNKSYTDTRTVALWTTYYGQRTLPELSSWRHCPNDIKGSCVFTSDRSKYEVWLIFSIYLPCEGYKTII